ncbi:hypothetical protein GCM10023187_29900 [Nibrella viscosa]|uniref:Restriction endonuclease type IV Mrr domain-containing protein n=1 Tax=Nibrella viscosa TaxID=1084524 RepID=A0ABP8KJV7_9BACT
MPKIYCLRANSGQYTNHFINGGYAAIGWLTTDLSAITSREELYPLYRKENPEDISNLVVGQQVGQIARFLFDIQPGDYIITPAANSELLHYGTIEPKPYYLGDASDGCPFVQRKKVQWAPQPIRRSTLSVPLQSTLKSSLAVFEVSQATEFFEAINKPQLAPPAAVAQTQSHDEAILKRLVELDFTEFELLVTELLTAIGFEAQHTGKPHDGGVDIRGELNIANLAKITLVVQVKRHQNLEDRIKANVLKALRASIPTGAQGAFVTTCNFHPAALEAATEPGFPRIGTVNGRQLVDLLIEHWASLPQELKDKLQLKPSLVLA